MNKNISAIGLKTIQKKRKAISEIIKRIRQNPDKVLSYVRKDGKTRVEQYGHIGDAFGLVLYGTRDADDAVTLNRWQVFAVAENNMQISNVTFEKMPSGIVYAYCEDEATGTELEFRLNNMMDYEAFKNRNSAGVIGEAAANIVGLGRIGNIIFPVEKTEDAIRMRAEENETRRDLLSRLRKGDESAEQKLFDHSVEIASAVRERLKTEDVLSVFEGYCLPYGTTEGTYALLGDIVAAEELTNDITGESVHALTLDVTGVEIELLINASDIVGLPIAGMRFMGICDLQGSIHF